MDIKKIVAKRETMQRSVILEKQNATKYLKEFKQTDKNVFDYI